MTIDVLLDTQVVLWWPADSDRLGAVAVESIDSAPVAYVSAASVWEVAIKTAAGKLEAPGDLLAELEAAGFRALPISWDHARRVADLPLHHRDPFDRLLVAQARSEALALVTADRAPVEYDVDVISAEH